jgi:SHS2 domain-containing protein
MYWRAVIRQRNPLKHKDDVEYRVLWLEGNPRFDDLFAARTSMEDRILEFDEISKEEFEARNVNDLIVKSDKEILDWLESQYDLHRELEIMYVVDGYQVEFRRDGNKTNGKRFHGETLRGALCRAMIDTW